VPVAPAGRTSAGWFDPIEHDPIVGSLLALPLAVPRALVGRELGGDPRATQRAVADMLAVRHMAPDLFAPPFEAQASDCPVVMGIDGGGRLLELLLQFPGP
jgi:hypothetical protein